jgi:hypothetical protein
MEFLYKLVEMVGSPEFYALVGALAGLLVALGKFLQAVETYSRHKHLSGKAFKWAGELGRLAEWLAPGNATEKNHPESIKTVSYWVEAILDKFKR